MKRTTCPYLGLKDDPTTALSFPSPGNVCYQARPIASVKGTYQERYCLTENHTACPLYQATHPMPLPASMTSSAVPFLSGRQVFVLFGIPVIVVAIALFAYIFSHYGPQFLTKLALAQPVPVTGPVSGDPNFNLLGVAPAQTQTPFSLLDPQVSPQPTKNNCPLPANWTTYAVNPTDSLFRLSVVYGVSVEDLQRANCFGNKTLILPGETIYVPIIPTDTPLTPVVTPQPRRFVPVNTATAQLPQPKPSNTPFPTAVILTATNTALPTGTTQPTATIPPPTVTPSTQPPTPTLPVPTATTQPPAATATLPAPTATLPVPYGGAFEWNQLNASSQGVKYSGFHGFITKSGWVSTGLVITLLASGLYRILSGCFRIRKK